MTQASLRLFLVFLLVANFTHPVWAQAPSSLRIVIVEGDGAINNVRQRVNREPVVQVEDENRKPIAGAVVVFFLPDQGPSGSFVNGSKTLTVTTDNQGQAAARGIKFNNQTGQLQIRVTASFQGLTASAIITQTNVAGGGGGGGAAGGGLSTTAKVLIVVAILGGAGAAGAVVATRSGGSGGSGTPSGPTGIVLTPGTPTVGGSR
jgi:hypothetical protein